MRPERDWASKADVIWLLVVAKLEKEKAENDYKEISDYVKQKDTWRDNNKIETMWLTVKLQEKSKWVVNEDVTKEMVMATCPEAIEIKATEFAKKYKNMCHKEPMASALIIEGLGKSE